MRGWGARRFQMGKKAAGRGVAAKGPRHLARLVMIARNKKIYMPEVKALLSKYYQKFSKAGQLEFEDSTRGLETEETQDAGEE